MKKLITITLKMKSMDSLDLPLEDVRTKYETHRFANEH